MNSDDDSEYDSCTESMGQGPDPLFDQLPMDLLPEKYLNNPEDPDCILDDTLAYEHGIENPHIRGKFRTEVAKAI